MDGLSLLWQWNPFDENNFEMTVIFISFFAVVAITTYLANNVFGMSEADYKREMDKYAEEGRLYAENEWGEFKNKKKPPKDETMKEKKMK